MPAGRGEQGKLVFSVALGAATGAILIVSAIYLSGNSAFIYFQF